MAIISKEEIKVDVSFTGEEGYEDAASAQDELRKSTAKLDKGLDGLRVSGDAASQSMESLDKASSAAAGGMSVLKGAALAYLSIEGVKLGAQIAHEGAQLLDLEVNARRAGLQMDALRKASAGVITDEEIQRAGIFGRTMADGMGLSRLESDKLMESAAALSAAFGTDLGDSIKEVTKALDGETGALQDLFGMTIKSEDTFVEYAKTLGITAGELSTNQKRTAMLEELQLKLNSAIAEAPTGNFAVGLDRVGVQLDNIAAKAKKLAGILAVDLYGAFTGKFITENLSKAQQAENNIKDINKRIAASKFLQSAARTGGDFAGAGEQARVIRNLEIERLDIELWIDAQEDAAEAVAKLRAVKAKDEAKATASAKRSAGNAAARLAFAAKMQQRELVLVEAGYDRELAALEMKHADELAEAKKFNYDLTTLEQIHNEELQALGDKELDRQRKFFETEAKLAEAAAKDAAKIAVMRASLIEDGMDRALAVRKAKYDEEMRMAKGNADAQKLLTEQYQRDIADMQVDGIEDATERSVAAIKLSLKRQIEALGVSPSAGAPPKDPAAVLKSEGSETIADDVENMRQEREAESAEEAQATVLEKERVVKQGEYQEPLAAEAAHQEKVASLTEKAMNKITAIEAKAMSDRVNLYTSTTIKVASAVEESAEAMGKMGMAQEKVEAISMFVRGVKSGADAISFTGEAMAAFAAGNIPSGIGFAAAASGKTLASAAYFKGAMDSGYGGGGKSKPVGAGAGQYSRPGAYDMTGSGSDESKTEVVLSFTKPDEDDFFSSFARNLNANQRSDTATPIDNNRPLEI